MTHCFSRDAFKDYVDKHGSSKKSLVKSYAAQTPDSATVRKKLIIAGKVVEFMTLTVALFSENSLHFQVRHWQRRCQNL